MVQVRLINPEHESAEDVHHLDSHMYEQQGNYPFDAAHGMNGLRNENWQEGRNGKRDEHEQYMQRSELGHDAVGVIHEPID